MGWASCLALPRAPPVLLLISLSCSSFSISHIFSATCVNVVTFERAGDISLGLFYISLLSRYLNYCWMHLHVRKCGRLQEKHKLCHMKLEVLNCSNFLLCKQIKWCKVLRCLLLMRIDIGFKIKLVLNCCLGDCYYFIVSETCLLLDCFIVYVFKSAIYIYLPHVNALSKLTH